jgi:hypothetical protein
MSDTEEKRAKPKLSPLEAIQAKLDAQAEAEQEAREAQEAIDLSALFDLKQEHGVTGAVVAVKLPGWTEGVPTMAIARRPTKMEFKRFQDLTAKKDAGTPEAIKAAEQVVALCLLYPPPETFEKMIEVCPGIKVALGSAAVGLATAKAREDAKQ